jgi:hypothetical protein
VAVFGAHGFKLRPAAAGVADFGHRHPYSSRQFLPLKLALLRRTFYKEHSWQLQTPDIL